MTYKVGDTVTMSGNALDNYGEQWRDVKLRITHKATAYMSATEFYDRGRPKGFHPGFDGDASNPLFDLEIIETGKPLSFSLYQWELD